MRNSFKKRSGAYLGPYLDTLTFNPSETLKLQEYPFCLPIIKNLTMLEFPTHVTFFVGENGSGKSTLLEAIAHKAGFGSEGGSKNIQFRTSQEYTYRGAELLATELTLSWRLKPHHGYFFRAESFFNVANHIDTIAEFDWRAYAPYGGKSLHAQSHGESFLAFFQSQLDSNGFFIFDEPEAALSPQRQLTLLIIINEMVKRNNAQFIIATHSPLLLAYPGATIYSCDSDSVQKIAYTDTDHYQISRRFLENHEGYLQQLFNDKES